MSLGDMMTLLKLRRGKYSIVENRVDPRAVASGKPVRELDLPHECVLTAIFRGGELIIPRGETILQPDDEVLALVHISQLDRLATLLRGQG
jgi:trk system potassium uptake protein TrkA